MTKQDRYRKSHPWVRFVEWARRRCRDPKHRDYPNYGARGIVCELNARLGNWVLKKMSELGPEPEDAEAYA